MISCKICTDMSTFFILSTSHWYFETVTGCSVRNKSVLSWPCLFANACIAWCHSIFLTIFCMSPLPVNPVSSCHRPSCCYGVTFQGRSVSIGASTKKSVIGSVSVFIHVHQVSYGSPNVQFCSPALVGTQVICVRGLYCIKHINYKSNIYSTKCTRSKT